MRTLERRADLVAIALLSAAVLVLDATAKAAAEARLDAPLPVVRGFELDVSYNTGVAFGLLREAPRALVLLAVAAVALVVGLALVRRWVTPTPLTAGLVLGGALGNLLDRAGDGRVTDFLQLAHWPTFNLADVALTAGGILFALEMSRRDADGHGRPPAAEAR